MSKVYTSSGTFAVPDLKANRKKICTALITCVLDNKVVLIHGRRGVGKSVLTGLCGTEISEKSNAPFIIVTVMEGWTIGSCLMAAGRLLEETGLTGTVKLLGSPDRTPASGIRSLIGLLNEGKATLVLDNAHFLSSPLISRVFSEANKGLDGGRLILVTRQRLRKENYTAPSCDTFEVPCLFDDSDSFRLPSAISADDLSSIVKALDNDFIGVYLFSILLELETTSSNESDNEICKGLLDDVSKETAKLATQMLFKRICDCFTDNEMVVLQQLSCFRKNVSLKTLSGDSQVTAISGAHIETLVRRGFISVRNETYTMHSVLKDLFKSTLEVDCYRECQKKCAIACSLKAFSSDEDSLEQSLWWLECFYHALECSDYGLMLKSLENSAHTLEKNGFLFEVESALQVSCELGLDLSVNLLIQKARILHLLGNLDYAEDDLKDVLTKELTQKQEGNVNFHLGLILQDKNDYDKALTLYYKALEASRKASDSYTEAKVLNRIATIAKDRGKYERARNFYLQGIKSAKKTSGFEEVYFSVHNLARICFYRGEYDKALDLYTDLVFGHEYTPGLLTQALARNGMAEVLRAQGKTSKAREHFTTNERYYRDNGNRFGLSFTLRNLGELDLSMGYFDRARNRFVESLRLAKLIGNLFGEADCRRHLGCLSTMLGDIIDGQLHFDHARELFTKIGNRRGIGQVSFNEASLDIAASSLNKALKHLEESLSIREEIGDLDGLAWVLFEKGNLSLHKGDYYVADRLYSRGLREMKKVSNQNGEAACIAGLGKVSSSTGHYDKALEYFTEALDLLLSIDDSIGRASVLVELGNLFRLKGDYGSAVASYEEAIQLAPSSVLSLIHADAFDGISLIKSDQGKIAEAEELFRRSLDVRKRMEGTLIHAASLSNLASIKGRMGSFDEEKSLLDQSFRILKALDNKREIQKTLGCLATIERNRGNYEEAERFISEAYKYGREISDRRGMAIALQQSAQLKLHENNLDEARLLFEASLAIKRQIDDQRGIVATLVAMGHMYLTSDLMERGVDLFNEAVLLAEENKYDDMLVSAQLGQAEIEIRKGNYSSASAIADRVSTIVEDNGSSPMQSAGLSRIWAMLAAEQGEKDDAVFLLNFARDLYSELGNTYDREKLDEEIKALSKDSLFDAMDRRISLIEELESLEIMDAETDKTDDAKYQFSIVLAFEMKDLSKCSVVFPSSGSEKDPFWQGERGGLFLQFFTHTTAALKSLIEVDMTYINKIVAHGGMTSIKAGIGGGDVGTLPFRLISTVSDGECIMTSNFVGGTSLVENPGLKLLSEITIREQVKPLSLYSIALTKLFAGK